MEKWTVNKSILLIISHGNSRYITENHDTRRALKKLGAKFLESFLSPDLPGTTTQQSSIRSFNKDANSHTLYNTCKGLGNYGKNLDEV